jgi:rhodanese-related sulfurtransferase
VSAASGRMRLLVVLLILVGGMLPLALHWAIWGRAVGVSPRQARAMLAEQAGRTLLVDVRSPREYDSGHLEAAVSWPYELIARARSSRDVLPRYPGKRLITICDGGLMGAAAAARLQTFSRSDVFYVSGGMQAWRVERDDAADAESLTRGTASGAGGSPAFRDSSPHEQWAAVLSAFAVKPTYMLAALVLAFLLRRQRATDLAALRWGLIFFFAGEAFCAANYLVFAEESALLEYLHSFGMVLSFAFAAYAAFEGIDSRLIHYSDPEGRCAAVPLCHGCIKHADVPCGLKRTFLLAIPILIVLAAMPLCAEPLGIAYNTRVLGTLYTYTHPVVHQVFEIRLCPLAAMLLLTVSLAILLVRRDDPVRPAKVFFAGGLGCLGFSFLRMIIFHVYQDNQVWFTAWEELTELAFIAATAGMLWIFRYALLARGADEGRGQAPT